MNTFGCNNSNGITFCNLKNQSANSGKYFRLKATLLLTGSMTVLAGAGITADIPEIQMHFQETPYAGLLSKLILTLPALMIALLAPFAGRIVDKYGRKKPLILSLILYALAGTSGFFLDNLFTILAGRAILGVAVAGLMTVNTTLIGDYFEGTERSHFMGIQSAFMSFGGVVFVTAGGLLADISWRAPFLIYSFSLLILALAVKYIYEPTILVKTAGEEEISKPPQRMTEYLIVYLVAFLGMLFFYVIPTQAPFLLHQTGQLSNTQIGYSVSAAILAGAITSLQYGRIKQNLNFHQIYSITFALMGAGYFAIMFVNGYWFIMAGLVVAGFGTGLLMPNTNLWLITLAPAERRGRMVGYLNMAVYTGQFLSPILLYPLVEYQSIGFSVGVSGAFLLVMALFFLLSKMAGK